MALLALLASKFKQASIRDGLHEAVPQEIQ